MTKFVQLAVVLLCFLFFPLASAHAQSFEVLTPQVKPGGLVVIKIYDFRTTGETGILIFDTIYQPNKNGIIFVGVSLNTKPDIYSAYLVNLFSKERMENSLQEIKVVPAKVKTRRRGIAKPSKRRAKEVSAIAAAYQKADHEEFYAEGPFHIPLSEIFITSDFAVHHSGVDLRASVGTKVSAINSGRVIMTAVRFSLEGNMVIIDHGSGIFSYYMHLSRIQVRDGQMVTEGEVVGLAGATGSVRGPHLHLGVKINGTNVDPLLFIDIINQLSIFGEKP